MAPNRPGMVSRRSAEKTARRNYSAPKPAEVSAVVAGTRVLGALIAESVAAVDPAVTMPQLRVLILADTQGPRNSAAVAADLGVHPSNATRICDRLVEAGLLERRTAAQDRRQVVLSLTAAGKRLVDQVMRHRQVRITEILYRMPPEERSSLARGLRCFTRAASDPG